jgi:uncharacterized protein YggT (Ycf19 family)
VLENFWGYWYFHIPNLMLAALIYTMIGRYVLELLFSKTPDVVIIKVFRQITDPVLNLVRAVTPGVVPNGLTVVFAIVWLMGLRMFLLLTVLATGVKLTTQGG